MQMRTYRLALLALFLSIVGVTGVRAQEEAPPKRQAPLELDSPPPIPEERLGPTLRTTPVRRGEPGRGFVVVDSSYLPRDEIARRNSVAPGVDPEKLPKKLEKFWVLDFAFKPIRMITVELPGKGRRQVFYMYYRVVNRTGEPRMFVPQFTLVTDDGRAYPDQVLPQAVRLIEAREGANNTLNPTLGAVSIMGYIPPSDKNGKEGIDDAVYGVAVWDVDRAIARSDALTVYITGLSDGSYPETLPDGQQVIRYKTLQVNFSRPGDERNLNEKEIRLLDPPYEWIYR
ncbi:MAG: hypothetical protein IRY99_21570 [Isosphaeraceae bacterium]|nr:hypothetical protein [Isosphaeraceae bacterium]